MKIYLTVTLLWEKLLFLRMANFAVLIVRNVVDGM